MQVQQLTHKLTLDSKCLGKTEWEWYDWGKDYLRHSGLGRPHGAGDMGTSTEHGNQKESAHEGPEAGKSSVHSAGRKAGMAGVKREEKLRAGEVES